MSNYRKIWEETNGPIPLDEFGRRMEIHHLDGDRTNNELSNLSLLTINEHYDIHYDNGDWAACQSIINRMKVSPEEKSKTCSDLAKKRFADGTHHFLDPEFIKKQSNTNSIRFAGSGNPMFGKPVSGETRVKRSNSHKKLVEQGVHHLQSAEHRDKMRDKAITELANGTHVFQQERNKQKAKEVHQKMLANNEHPFNKENRLDPNKIKMYCSLCNKETTLPAYKRFHKH
jgi:hypothetical protein